MPTIEDRLLAIEYATAVALCFATMPLVGDEPGGRDAAAQQVKRMLIALRQDDVDTRNNPGFDKALTTIVARYLNYMGAE